MATLQSCRFASPAAPFAAVSTSSVKPPSMVASGRGFHAGPRMKLRQDGTAALRPCVVVRAQHHGGALPAAAKPAEHYFADERKHVMGRYNEIASVDYGCLYVEATSMSGKVCLSANDALKMASQVMASAGLNVGAPNEISIDTVHGTIRACVQTFVYAADVSYEKRVRKDTVLRFLGALKLLASITHILLENALEALSHTNPKASLSEYAFNRDVEAMRDKFKQEMNDLEDELTKASSPVDLCKMVIPVILEGTKMTGSFVGLMVARRNRALGKPHQSKVAMSDV